MHSLNRDLCRINLYTLGPLKSLTNLTTTRPVAASTPLQENNLPANHLQLLTFNSRLFFIVRKDPVKQKGWGKILLFPRPRLQVQRNKNSLVKKSKKCHHDKTTAV